MNLLVLGIAAFMLLFMLRGYRIGLFKSAAGAIGIVLAVFLTALCIRVLTNCCVNRQH